MASRRRVIRWFVGGGLVALAVGVYAGLSLSVLSTAPRPPSLPDGVALVERVREVARLEALDVELRKQVSWRPDPVASGSMAVDLIRWASDAVRPVEGTMWVAATAHVGIDLSRLDAARITVRERTAWIDLPALVTTVSLEPASTHAIRSNLGPDQTMALLDKARSHLTFEVERDVRTQARARVSVERALRGLLLPMGFDSIEFAAPPARTVRGATASGTPGA